MLPRISARHAKISPETKEHIEGICEKLGQFCDEIIDCEVMIEKSKAGTGVELVLKVPQHTLTASACDENLFKALSEARERMEVQLKKYHDRILVHR